MEKQLLYKLLKIKTNDIRLVVKDLNYRVWIKKLWDDHEKYNILFKYKLMKNVKIASNEVFLYIKYAQTIIGFVNVICENQAVRLKRFFILAEYRNQGIGSYILKELTRIVNELSTHLLVNVYNGNKSLSLYKKQGFIPLYQQLSYSKIEKGKHNNE